MIEKITDKIAEILHDKFPEFVIYDDGKVPQNFKRPALLIAPNETKHERLSFDVAKHTTSFTILILLELDDNEVPNFADLRRTAEVVCDAFDTGYIKVDSRACKVVSQKMDLNPMEAYIDVAFEYKKNIRPQNTTEIIEKVNVRKEIKNGTYE